MGEIYSFSLYDFLSRNELALPTRGKPKTYNIKHDDIITDGTGAMTSKEILECTEKLRKFNRKRDIENYKNWFSRQREYKEKLRKS